MDLGVDVPEQSADLPICSSGTTRSGFMVAPSFYGAEGEDARPRDGDEADEECSKGLDLEW
jgi:hypothetical protein